MWKYLLAYIVVKTGVWLIAWPGSLAITKFITVNVISQPNRIKKWSFKLNCPGNFIKMVSTVVHIDRVSALTTLCQVSPGRWEMFFS